MKAFFVYILASRSRALYTGVTGNLQVRIQKHRDGTGSDYTKRFRIHRLVYFETYSDPNVAIERETQVKSWRREKRVALIEAANPEWRDMYEELFV